LFSGCGGLSLGVVDALAATGQGAHCVAVDTDDTALAVYRRNLPHAETVKGDVMDIIDGDLGTPLTRTERKLRACIGEPVMLVGGPPCQGHSAFNNRTRHRDTRNALYSRMVRAAEVLKAEHVVIENVPGALNDRGRVVQTSIAQLEQLGYDTRVEVVDAAQLGVAQRRKRLVVMASRRPLVDGLIAAHRVPLRSVRWAIEDLKDVVSNALLDAPARSAPQTRRRIARLFAEDLYELPNSERPPCHAEGGHSYVSIYGRLRWDEPSQTVTTGFYSMCMGRNVHPSRPRTITAHEAARLQGLPDHFDFRDAGKRSELARLIGNAVPPKLGFAAAIELLR
jgi:DNA (cytosine-5)-methyltransferase 1